jgi:hypothetical protein
MRVCLCDSILAPPTPNVACPISNQQTRVAIPRSSWAPLVRAGDWSKLNAVCGLALRIAKTHLPGIATAASRGVRPHENKPVAWSQCDRCSCLRLHPD